MITIIISFLKIQVIIFISHTPLMNGPWITNFENNYQNYQNTCDNYEILNMFLLLFFIKRIKILFYLFLKVILFIYHMARDKWTSWIINFEKSYQNDQNIHGRYLISWWCDNVILYSLLSLMACYMIYTNVLLFNYLGIEVYNHYLHDVSYKV